MRIQSMPPVHAHGKPASSVDASQRSTSTAVETTKADGSTNVPDRENPAAPAKATLEYLKELKKGELKGGVLEGKLLTPKQLKEVADLPSREVLLAGIAGGLNSGAQGIAGILNNIIADIAVLVEKVAEKQQSA